MSIKIAYLHGLESNNIGVKNDWLKSVSNVYDPLIDYKQPNIYQNIKNDLINFEPNIIIGSSMGGFFAYELAKELNISAILFNPALHSRSFTPDMSGYEIGVFKPSMFFVFGKNDDIINPLLTIVVIEKQGYTKNDCLFLSHGHQTSSDVFIREVHKFISKN